MNEFRKRKRGRPRNSNSNYVQYRLRMSGDMKERLDGLSRMTGKSRADIFREAFNIYENLEKMKLDDESDTTCYDDFEGDLDEKY